MGTARRALTLLVCAAPLRAWAGPCDHAAGRAPAEPVELGVREAAVGLGAPRAPCRDARGGLALVGDATLDVPDFYGTVAGAARLSWRRPLGPLELSADLAGSFWFAQNASLKATDWRAGPLAVGVLWERRARVAGWPLAWAPALRVIVPGSELGRAGDLGGAELAVHAALRPARWLDLDGHLVVLGVAAESVDGAADGRGELALAAGVALWPAAWLALPLGVELATGWHGWDGLDHALVRGGARLTARGWPRLDLGLAAVVAGRERPVYLLRLGATVPL